MSSVGSSRVVVFECRHDRRKRRRSVAATVAQPLPQPQRLRDRCVDLPLRARAARGGNKAKSYCVCIGRDVAEVACSICHQKFGGLDSLLLPEERDLAWHRVKTCGHCGKDYPYGGDCYQCNCVRTIDYCRMDLAAAILPSTSSRTRRRAPSSCSSGTAAP